MIRHLSCGLLVPAETLVGPVPYISIQQLGAGLGTCDGHGGSGTWHTYKYIYFCSSSGKLPFLVWAWK